MQLDWSVVRDLQLLENDHRGALADDEIASRATIAQHHTSLCDPTVSTCPPPDHDTFYASFLRRRGLELTEKYQGLITRHQIREARWTEYTTLMLREVVEDEAKARQQLLVDSMAPIPQLTLCHLQLQMVSAKGTEGTVIFVEETEREVRYHVVLFEQVAAYEALVEQELLERHAAQQATDNRLAREANDRGVLEAEECGARWTLEEQEDSERHPIHMLEPTARGHIYVLYLWRCVVQEANERIAMENEFDEILTTSPYAEMIERHDALFLDWRAVVAQQRAELEATRAKEAQLFAQRESRDGNEKEAPLRSSGGVNDRTHEPEREEKEIVDDEEGRPSFVSFYGHTFCHPVPMRAAGELPPPPPALTRRSVGPAQAEAEPQSNHNKPPQQQPDDDSSRRAPPTTASSSRATTSAKGGSRPIPSSSHHHPIAASLSDPPSRDLITNNSRVAAASHVEEQDEADGNTTIQKEEDQAHQSNEEEDDDEEVDLADLEERRARVQRLWQEL